MDTDQRSTTEQAPSKRVHRAKALVCPVGESKDLKKKEEMKKLLAAVGLVRDEPLR